MKDYRRVFWDFSGRGGLKAAFRMLNELDLRHLADQNVGVPRARPKDLPDIVYWIADKEDSSGCIDLLVTDPRLKLLRDYLKRSKASDGHELALRRYSSKDLSEVPWLRYSWGAPLPSAEDYGQEFDFKKACKVCGAGAVAKPPLVTKLSEMKKAKMGTCWDGSLVTTAEVAAAVIRAKLTGVKFFPVHSVKKATPDPRYRYMQVAYTWPRAEPATKFSISVPCKCGRAGHYEMYDEVTEYQVKRPRVSPPDFGLTWEMWGGPLKRPHGSLRVTCGQPAVILSQRARRVIGEAVGSWVGKPITVLERGK